MENSSRVNPLANPQQLKTIIDKLLDQMQDSFRRLAYDIQTSNRDVRFQTAVEHLNEEIEITRRMPLFADISAASLLPKTSEIHNKVQATTVNENYSTENKRCACCRMTNHSSRINLMLIK